MKHVSVILVIATLFSFNILLTIGIDNFLNWKFVFSLIGFINFVVLIIFDYRKRKAKTRT